MRELGTVRPTGYLPQLTWLRGVAALFVIVSHTLRATEVSYGHGDAEAKSIVLSFFDLGSFGVVCFFALSGCTLYLSNANCLSRKGIRRFYLKRILRIWPAFVVSFLVYLTFGMVFSSLYGDARGVWVEHQYLQDYSIPDMVRYVSLTFNVTGPPGLFNNAYWSLPVEFQYYLLFPALILSIKMLGALGPVFLAGVSQAIYRIGIPIGFDSILVFKLAFTFFGGCLAGHLFLSTQKRLSGLRTMLLIGVLICCATWIKHLPTDYMAETWLPEKWIAFGMLSIATVAVTLFSSLRLPKPVDDFLSHTGTISYSLYLYHNLFISISVLLMIHFEVVSGPAKISLVLACTLIPSYLVSRLSYNFIELPAMRLTRVSVK